MPDKTRTISVTARGHGRFSRLLLACPDRAESPVYDAALARELLARTGEFPSSKRALLAILTEYRHALHDLAVSPTADAPVPTATTNAITTGPIPAS